MTAETTVPAREPLDLVPIQRRTLRLLSLTQIIGGVGVTVGITVGSLLAARLGGTFVSGIAQSAMVVGAALLVIPVSRVMAVGGRRPGLALAYLVGALGGGLVVAATALGWVPLLLLGMFLFGGGSAANLQARYAAVDLAPAGRRAGQLSLIVWATTIGAVAGPNLAPLADLAVRPLGVPLLAGPFVFGAVAFVIAAAALFLLLRPDPLLVARASAAVEEPAVAGGPAARGGVRAGLRVVAHRPRARLGISAVAVGHLTMVGVMVMTPVHLGDFHSDAAVLRVVGIVLSLHIAGMYALAPVVGMLADRFGRRTVILAGAALLLAACAVAGTAGHDTARLSVGLVLLGLGWSCTMVAGSTLLSESVPVADRPAVQGLSDLTMGLAGAAAGALAGLVIGYTGYAILNLLAAIAVVPMVALALRTPTADAPAPA